jgi:hypothetical protein
LPAMLRIEKIEDAVAVDEWRYNKADGTSVVSRVEIGKPQRAPDDPNGDWYCPVFIEHFTDRIVPAYGVGPVDALMNALILVRTFADQIGQFTPRASDYPDDTQG